METINLTKFIADNSSYSRRQAEDLIRRGLVIANGEVAKLGAKADSNTEVEIDGQIIEANRRKIYIKLNKPADYVCTNRFFKGENNIFSLIDIKERLFSVGRLDKDSCGLLILTNDGDLTYELTHPKFEHEKIYLVTLEKNPDLQNNEFIKEVGNGFINGLDIGENTLAKAKEISFLSNNEVKIVLTEGKKRQIREMFKVFNLRIEKLQRINFAGIGLGDLQEGEWKHLSDSEIKKIKNN